MPIDFLAIGHVTLDRSDDGYRLGGTASYAAVTALRLGRIPGILTRAALPGLAAGVTQLVDDRSPALLREALAGIQVCQAPSRVTTTFSNVYRAGLREQRIEAVAGPISPWRLPSQWAGTPLVLLGPVARELPGGWANAFPQAVLGLTPQGFMRRWDGDGRVEPAPWGEASGRGCARSFLRHADVVILSRDDAGDDEVYLAKLAALTRLMVVTDGWHGATIWRGDDRLQVPARKAVEVDPTGAGDVFAAAFLIRLAETGDPALSARFANAAASFSVEGAGMTSIPFRPQVDAWVAGGTE